MGSYFPRYTQELPRILYRERKANSRRHLIFGYVVLVDVVSSVSALQLQACWDIASLPSKAGMGVLPESFPLEGNSQIVVDRETSENAF